MNDGEFRDNTRVKHYARVLAIRRRSNELMGSGVNKSKAFRLAWREVVGSNMSRSDAVKLASGDYSDAKQRKVLL